MLYRKRRDGVLDLPKASLPLEPGGCCRNHDAGTT